MAEQRDLSVRAITIFGLSLVATIMLVMLASGLLSGYWHKAYLAHQPMPLPVRMLSQVPPEPRLQVNAPVDLEHWRATEDTLLNNYAWVDRENGIVRIPIGRAMELIEQHGVVK
ncbi:MAG TPA: hypothetical protein VMP11_07465 [Verrucomicrobiae bacterium]|nr:hypothetical protein [Verrucomicrobiae bacterium]